MAPHEHGALRTWHSALRDAAARLEGRVVATPLLRSSWLSDAARAEVFLKLENQQLEGSFKTRGAFNALLEAPRGRVVTASAGNHGRSLSFAARELGARLTVFAPRTAPAAKLDFIRAHGATLELCDSYDDAEEGALTMSRTQGLPYISPYNHPHVVAGAGTVGLELIGETPDVILVPVGGGGLVSGIALAAQSAARPPRVIGVEAEASPAFTTALARGRIVPIDVRPTLADGLAGNAEAGSITFELIRDLTAGIVTVSEDEIAAAMDGLLEHEGQRAEGAGAVATAALMAGRVEVAGKRVVVIVSGGNR